MDKFVNWSYNQQTVSKDEAIELIRMSNIKESYRTSGKSSIPIKQGVEARYFSFGKLGVLKTFDSNFEKKAKDFDSINPRLEWLLEHNERVPFIYGLAKYNAGSQPLYKHAKTDYIFVNNLSGDQFYDIRRQNMLQGFGNPESFKKWNELTPKEQSATIDYMISKLSLMSNIPQEDYNQLIKGMLRLDRLDLSSDMGTHNMLYCESIDKGNGRFGFVDLREPTHNPDIEIDRWIKSLEYTGKSIVKLLAHKKLITPSKEESLYEYASIFSNKISTALDANEKLKYLAYKGRGIASLENAEKVL